VAAQQRKLEDGHETVHVTPVISIRLCTAASAEVSDTSPVNPRKVSSQLKSGIEAAPSALGQSGAKS